MQKIWLKQYPAGVPADVKTDAYPSLVALIDDSLRQHRERTAYLHFKDINPIIHKKVLSDGVAFFDAISLGIFCPVGQGMVDFGALAKALEAGFDGPGTIEQDRDFRSTTTALEDAKASLDYLRGIGIAN